MAPDQRPNIAVSAPGKVLLAGGYLVLDREYTGLVLGLNARIHVHVRPLVTSSGVTLEEIIVKSPQFKEAVWEYGYRWTERDGGMQVTPLTRSWCKVDKRSSATGTNAIIHPNPFVETTLAYVLTFIAAQTQSPIIHPSSVTILADDAYYTQPSSSSSTSESTSSASSPPVPTPISFFGEQFKYFGLRLWDAHKTGLGSSAALVTALTAALLTHYLPAGSFSIETDHGKDVLHRLAQTAHCAAQGKVGSGFDVASAVYGSCIYRRFDPSLIEQIGTVGFNGFAKRLKELVTDGKSPNGKEWDAEVLLGEKGVALPKGLRLVMADVDCGSKTVGMVKKVLEWRKDEPDEASMLWTQLHKSNMAIGEELFKLNAGTGSNDYDELRKKIDNVRSLIRDMSRLSGVPIEPEDQTKLLDQLSEVNGVVGGVVPGAGGFDALAILVKDDREVLSALKKRITEINASSKNAAAEGRLVSLLNVREDAKGIKKEDVEKYEAWIVRSETSQNG